MNDRWTVGVDPGLGETAMVLLDPAQKYRAGATFTAPRHTGCDLERIVNLAASVTGTLAAWSVQYGFAKVLVGMEYPIVSAGNITAYRKQVSLLHEIERNLWVQAQASRNVYGDDATLTRVAEINPSVSKRVLTGDSHADKNDMIRFGPFAEREDLARSTREALADAYGHAIAALDIAEVEQVLFMEELKVKPYRPKFIEEKDA